MRLVLLTSRYPYGTGEVFIENELKHIYKYFDEIVIYNFNGATSENHKFIPPNAKIVTLGGLYANRFGTLKAAASFTSINDMVFDVNKLHYHFGKQLINGIGQYELARKILVPELEKQPVKDTVFYSYWLSYHAYALACFKKNHPDAFCISRSHNVDCFLARETSFFRRETLSKMDMIFPCSHMGTKEIGEKIFPFIDGACPILKTSYLGVECSEIKNPEKNSDVFRIVSCANVYEVKRLDLIIDALSQINDISIEWIHFGGGALFNDMKKYASEKLGKCSNITFNFAGQVNNAVIKDYYKNHHIDLFINSSDYEGIPVSVMEAMSAGIVCTARDVGGNGEVIPNSDCGFLMNAEISPADIVQIIRIMQSLSLSRINQIKENASDFITTTFNEDHVYDAYIQEIIDTFKKRNAKI